MTNLEQIDLDTLDSVLGGKKQQAHPDWTCSRLGGGARGYFVDSEQVPDPENATFKTKRACESWARKNLDP